MTIIKLALRSIRYYLPLVIIISLGVAVATAVITASLITGSSFNASLSKYLNMRRGDINSVLQSSSFVHYNFADEIDNSSPVLSLTAAGENSKSSVIPSVNIYGISNKFNDIFPKSFMNMPSGRSIIINNSLSNDLDVKVGDDIYLNFQKLSDINSTTLFADRNAYKNTIKLKFKIQQIIDDNGAGSFVVSGSSLQPRVAYIDYSWLSKRLNIKNKVNLILSKDNYSTFSQNVQKNISDKDLGLFTIDSFIYFNGVVFPEEIVNKLGKAYTPISTYLVDKLEYGSYSASYLMVSYNPILNFKQIADDEIILLKWVADDLKVRKGDKINLYYQRYVRNGTFQLEKRSLKVKAIVSNDLPYLNRNFSPEISGVTDVDEIGSWDAPFPFVSSRVTARDEEYWKLHRAAPRGFISEKLMKSIWMHEGNKDWVTSLISPSISGDLENDVKTIPLKNFGIFVIDYYDLINKASSGKTDMTSLLISTGIFIIAAAVLFALLFMQLMIDYRKKQIGISLTCGLDSNIIKKQFLIEGSIISFFGVITGVVFGIFLSYLLIEKFNTVWNISGGLKIDCSYNFSDILISAISVFILMLFMIWRNINISIKNENVIALIYNIPIFSKKNYKISKFYIYFFICAVVTFIIAYNNIMGRFLAAIFLLLSLILFSKNYFYTFNYEKFDQLKVVNRLIQSNLKRVILIIVMISSSVFILMSTATFIKTDKFREDLSSSTGYSCRIDFPDVPTFSLSSRLGRESAGISTDDEKILKNVDFIPLFNNIGDDISCVAADKPTGVKIIGITKEFVEKSKEKYDFSTTKSNHIWADEETLYWSLKYISGKGEIPVKDGRVYSFNSATPMLDSIFGSEVLISENDFKQMYPSITIPSIYMVSIPNNNDDVIQLLRARLGPLGATVRKSSEILKSYHNVQNGYIEIFVNLSIIGLLLGIFAHQAIIFRTSWEMRREIAILNALGLSKTEINNIFLHFIIMITMVGAIIGITSALVTVIPAISTNGRLVSMLISTIAIILIYLLSCFTIIFAVKKISSSNIIELLKSE
jgi:ABC-type antimicrobial peptide transport system permease subunit